MTQHAPSRLHLVTGNHVVDGVDADRPSPGAADGALADLVRRGEELDTRIAAASAPRTAAVGGLVAAGAVLTVVLALLAVASAVTVVQRMATVKAQARVSR